MRWTARRSGERGHARHGWLESRHTFSFADYRDPRFMGFRALRVINEDRVQPGKGFGTHAHRDMEIISYVLAGELRHKDSMGNGEGLRPGEVQRMSAGTGVSHSEFNGSATELVHFLQIWLLPERGGLPPSYEQKLFPAEERADRLRLVASRDARDGAVAVHQDVDLYASLLGAGKTVRHVLRPGRGAWVQVARGAVRVGELALATGDAAATEDPGEIAITAAEDAEFLLFDLG
jgi:redox-sensitive bicupin YhaK (pirin superfamily)